MILASVKSLTKVLMADSRVAYATATLAAK